MTLVGKVVYFHIGIPVTSLAIGFFSVPLVFLYFTHSKVFKVLMLNKMFFREGISN